MKREETAGISEEFDQVLKQVEPETEEAASREVPDKSRRRAGQAWRQPIEEDIEKLAEKEDSEEQEERQVTGDTDGLADAEDQDKIEAVSHRHHRKSEGRRSGPASSAILHPSDGLIAAFFVPVIIMIVIFAQRGIFPFGQESFLRTDMYHQYAPFFSEFQHKLREGDSLLYSWDIGLGVNFAALYAYYLASPLNWLLLLCPKDLIIEFMTYLVVIKTGLCGLTFAWYLRRHNNRIDFGAAFFAVFYALSGYMAAYSWNIMWLDCILLLPLIILGLERLVKEKKPLLYCITLGLSILSNYYISIMICMFMVMYFICLLILEGRRSIKDFFMNFLQFGVYSLIAGGLAAVVLLPEIFALQSTASGDFNFPKTFEAYFSIIDMLARHIGNVQTETGLAHWPNIYCGVAVFMFFLLYLACRRIPVKEKAVTCGLLLMFFASFSVNVLNFIWHGFHYPNSLPGRQSFIYIFLMLTLCYRAYMYLDVTPKKHIAFSFWGAVCYVLLAQKLVTEKAFHFSVFYVAILFLAAYAGIIYLYKDKRLSSVRIALLALLVVAVEAAVNTTVTSVSTTSRTAYKEDNKDVLELTKNLSSDNGFYRVEMIDRKTKNDGAWMNFPSVSLFSSLAHADLSDFFEKVGCESSTNAYSITGGTPVVDSLFSVKYALYPEAQTNNRLILNQNMGKTYLYENPYTLPLGFMIPDIMEDSWQLDMKNPVDVQNDLSDVLGAAHVFSDADIEEAGSSVSFTPEKAGEYYVYILNKKVKSVTVAKGESSKTYDNMNRGYLLELGFCPAGETITIKNKGDSEALNARVYRFEEEGLKAIYEVLNTSPLNIIKWEDDKLEGVIEMRDTGTMFLSVPYDKGWSFKVDGQPVTAKRVFTAFTGIELDAGRHTITMKYMPEGLKEGAVLSAISIGLLILLVLLERFGRTKKENRIPTPYKKLDEEWHGVDRREENK